MGRPKGSKNKTTRESENLTPQKKNPSLKQAPEGKTEVFAVSLLDTPLDTPLFLCRSCHCSFETTEEYAQHNCRVQTYTVAIENEDPENQTADYQHELDITEDISEAEDIQSPEPKTKRRYKKRAKKEMADKNPIQCETCKKTFTRKYHLERHMVHTSCNPGTIERQEYSCEVCDKKITRIDNLRMHLRAHLGQKSRTKDFQCPYCDKSFYGSSLLNIHVRTHTREKPYRCDWKGCKKGFPSSGALTKHR